MNYVLNILQRSAEPRKQDESSAYATSDADHIADLERRLLSEMNTMARQKLLRTIWRLNQATA